MTKSTLRSSLDTLASSFAIAVLDAIRGASLDELVSERGVSAASAGGSSRPRGSRAARRFSAAARPKRTPAVREVLLSAEIEQVLERVVALVKKHKDGLGSAAIRAELGLEKAALPRLLHEGMARKMLKSKGQKRGTRYLSTG